MSTYLIGEDALRRKVVQVFVGFNSATGQMTAWQSTDGTTFTSDKVIFSTGATERFYKEMSKYFSKL